MSNDNCITQEQLKANFVYDKETGIFYRKRKKGLVLRGGYGIDRYGFICLNSTSYLCHRMAWLYEFGYIPSDKQIDHINGLKGDNRISNLRLVEQVKNLQNIIKATKASKTNVRGVYEYRKGRFSAQITVNYKCKHLGTFKTLEEATKAYLEAKKMYHSAPILESKYEND
jgi:hypothetical protein